MRPTQRLRMPLGRAPQSSYYDQQNRPGTALYRARQPYLVKNAITGVCIVGFVAAVCASRTPERRHGRSIGADERRADTFTIKAIGQDDFSDVPMPDAPAQPAHAPHMSASTETPSGSGDTNAAQDFQHTPLEDAAKEIKLLHILPETTTGHLNFELHAYQRDAAPPYAAISYAWGELKYCKAITIQHREFRVTSNCHYALQQIVHQHLASPEYEYYWMDSLCINQQDNEEKGIQVRLMWETFSEAAHVFSCVGPRADDSEYLFELLLQAWQSAQKMTGPLATTIRAAFELTIYRNSRSTIPHVSPFGLGRRADVALDPFVHRA
ncbi:uncharacterized protein LTR77_001584 [Saxophila tyrrhenica]|uniref:Heterokaryon incompatibility domain-containing protein n=1 Tax=Saxophila tyrrhenica TaxID=1690608 RepID=A0AAV9PP35_9PEZI|nr:hypothetical protein LTR77_001584 [Saxophila tyrrhenica]